MDFFFIKKQMKPTPNKNKIIGKKKIGKKKKKEKENRKKNKIKIKTSMISYVCMYMYIPSKLTRGIVIIALPLFPLNM